MQFSDNFRKLLIRAGRYLYGFPILGFGINHFIKPHKYEILVPGYFPFPKFWVYLTGIFFILSAISILINYRAKLASLLLAFMILIFIILIYLPDMMSNKSFMATYFTLIGGALLVAGTSKN